MAATKKATRRATKQTSSGKFDVVELGQKVWLAGLGAVSRAQREGPKLFESLVEEGREFQETARDTAERAFKNAIAQFRGVTDERMTTLRGKASDTWDDVEKMFQSRVQRALQQLGMPTSQEIRALTRKVDELNRGVEGLATQRRSTHKRASRTRAAAGQASHSATA